VLASQGDLLITSAGSAGAVQRWNLTTYPNAAQIWPSFNAVRLDGPRVSVKTLPNPP
jgi:hypothetical protein